MSEQLNGFTRGGVGCLLVCAVFGMTLSLKRWLLVFTQNTFCEFIGLLFALLEEVKGDRWVHVVTTGGKSRPSVYHLKSDV